MRFLGSAVLVVSGLMIATSIGCGDTPEKSSGASGSTTGQTGTGGSGGEASSSTAGTGGGATGSGGAATGTGGGATGSGGGATGSGGATSSSSVSSASSATSSSSVSSASSASSSSSGGGATQINGCDETNTADLTGQANVSVAFGGALGFKYNPACIKVSAGAKVTFNGDFGSHPLGGGEYVNGSIDTPNEGTTPFPITPLSTGMTATFTMSPAGTYPFYCAAHYSFGMLGAVFVQ